MSMNRLPEHALPQTIQPLKTPKTPAKNPVYKIPATLAELAAKYPPRFSNQDQEKPQPPALPEDPITSTKHQELIQETIAYLLDQATSPSPEAAKNYLSTAHPKLTQTERTALAREVQAHLEGLGKLEPLLEIPGITVIYVNSPPRYLD